MRELVNKRSANTKLYDLGKGKRKLSIRRGAPMHYRDADGKWQDIDLRAKEDQGDWFIDKAPYRLRVSQKFPGYQYRSESGSVSVRLFEANVVSSPKVQGNTYIWDIAIDCRCEILPLAHGVSTQIVLDSDQAPKSFVWQIAGSETLLQPPIGRDAKGNFLELIVEQDEDKQTITWTGRVANGRRLRAAGSRGWNTDVAYPVRIDPTINEAIAATGDDRDERVGSTLFTGFTTLVAGQSSYYDFADGFRFQTVNIPQASPIDSADFSIEIVNVTGTPDLRMYGNDVDDAATWSDPGNLPSAITKTTAFAEVDNFTTTGVKTVDVTTIVQEIVNRGSWTANNDLALVLFDNQASGGNFVSLADLSHATAQEAQLDIVYTSGAAPLVAGSGSFSLTGQTANLLRSLEVNADAGAFTFSGQSANLIRALEVNADVGSFLLDGQDATLFKSINVAADAGAFTLTGIAADLLRDLLISGEVGSYVLTGQDVALYRQIPIIADTGVFTLSGQDVDLTVQLLLSASAGGFTLNGQTANLIRSLFVLSETGAYVLTGQDFAILYQRQTFSAFPAGGLRVGSTGGGSTRLAGITSGSKRIFGN